MINICGCLIGVFLIFEIIKDFFRRLDIFIVEGYGMIENCVMCISLEVI